MDLHIEEYQVRKLLNVHKHVDGPWFWGKYSAHPYIGCRHGCEFCYGRAGRTLGSRDPNTYDTHIKVKVNAAQRLRRELGRQSYEVIAAGDWQQPVEERYQLSRAMLEVVLELGFPLFVVERSPLLVRDLDLLRAIDAKTWVGVTYSMSSLDPALERAFEPHSPSVRTRLKAMAQLADAGILVGTSLMPILPVVGDDERHLEDVVIATKDHGGRFVLGGGLTMAGTQAERSLAAAAQLDPNLVAPWRQLYDWDEGGSPSYGPPAPYRSRLGLQLRELCARHGLLDRMPRHVAPGPLALNKRIAERLFLKTYDLELEMAAERRIWAYRRAAWTVDEWPTSLAELHRDEGTAGLQALPGIGQRLAGLIGSWLADSTAEIDPSPP